MGDSGHTKNYGHAPAKETWEFIQATHFFYASVAHFGGVTISLLGIKMAEFTAASLWPSSTYLLCFSPMIPSTNRFLVFNNISKTSITLTDFLFISLRYYIIFVMATSLFVQGGQSPYFPRQVHCLCGPASWPIIAISKKNMHHIIPLHPASSHYRTNNVTF